MNKLEHHLKMISNFFGGILNIKKHTVLKAQNGITNPKNRTEPPKITQSHQILPRVVQNWTRIIQSYPKLHTATQNYSDATVDKRKCDIKERFVCAEMVRA